MGHREQLIAGAKKCLTEKGYARTTARDIVAASGTNLASIGYHFGSKDKLLTVAMIEALGEWGDLVEEVLLSARQASPMQRLETMWSGLINSLLANRGLWLASVEMIQHLDQLPEVRDELAGGYELARRGLISIFLGVGEDEVSEEVAHTTGSFLLALIPGLIAQWILDPDHAPSGADLAAGLRHLSAVISGSISSQRLA